MAITPISAPAGWLIEAAAGIGLDYSALTHETSDQFEVHVLKRHGNPALHGRATITAADFARIAGIVAAPDMAIIGAIRGNHTGNAYAKFENGLTYLYFGDVLNGKHNSGLRSETFYKITRPISLEHFKKPLP
jgi:hypothetical protein